MLRVFLKDITSMLILNIDTVKGLKKNVLNFEDQDYNLVHLDFKYTQFRSKKKHLNT